MRASVAAMAAPPRPDLSRLPVMAPWPRRKKGIPALQPAQTPSSYRRASCIEARHYYRHRLRLLFPSAAKTGRRWSPTCTAIWLRRRARASLHRRRRRSAVGSCRRRSCLWKAPQRWPPHPRVFLDMAPGVPCGILSPKNGVEELRTASPKSLSGPLPKSVSALRWHRRSLASRS